jgi:hypothetical protein
MSTRRERAFETTLKTQRNSCLRLLETLFVQRLNAGKKQILSTFEIIWDHLGRDDTAARDLMCFLSMFTRELNIDMTTGGLIEHRKWFPTGEYEMATPYYVLPFLELISKAPHLLDEMIGSLCDLKMANKDGNSITIHAVRNPFACCSAGESTISQRIY